jgi:hypothetical protein
MKPWVVNRKVNQFSHLSIGGEPPEKIPGRLNKPYCFLGLGQDVINVTPAGQF